MQKLVSRVISGLRKLLSADFTGVSLDPVVYSHVALEGAFRREANSTQRTQTYFFTSVNHHVLTQLIRRGKHLATFRADVTCRRLQESFILKQQTVTHGSMADVLLCTRLAVKHQEVVF